MPLSLVQGRIQIHNLLIFGQTPKPSCLGVWPCLPKVLISQVWNEKLSIQCNLMQDINYVMELFFNLGIIHNGVLFEAGE